MMAGKCQPGCVCGRHSRVTYGGKPYVPQTSEERRTKERAWRLANRDRVNAATRAWYAANRERALANRARYRSRKGPRRGEYNPAKARETRYGLSPERFAQMVAEQQALCYLCGEPLNSSVARRVHVDHDRSCCRGPKSCGTCVRGLACRLCNVGIAQFGDDPDRMRRVADNLEMANRRLRDPSGVVKRGSSDALPAERR